MQRLVDIYRDPDTGGLKVFIVGAPAEIRATKLARGEGWDKISPDVLESFVHKRVKMDASTGFIEFVWDLPWRY